MLSLAIEAARQDGLIKKTSIDKVIVDTTVMPKAFTHPTDSNLLETIREHLVKLALLHGMTLRLAALHANGTMHYGFVDISLHRYPTDRASATSHG